MQTVCPFFGRFGRLPDKKNKTPDLYKPTALSIVISIVLFPTFVNDFSSGFHKKRRRNR